MTKKHTKWHIVLINSSGVPGTVKHVYARNRRQRDRILDHLSKAPVTFLDAVPQISVTKIVTTRGWYHFRKTHPTRAKFSEKRKTARTINLP